MLFAPASATRMSSMVFTGASPRRRYWWRSFFFFNFCNVDFGRLRGSRRPSTSTAHPHGFSFFGATLATSWLCIGYFQPVGITTCLLPRPHRPTAALQVLIRSRAAGDMSRSDFRAASAAPAARVGTCRLRRPAVAAVRGQHLKGLGLVALTAAPRQRHRSQCRQHRPPLSIGFVDSGNDIVGRGASEAKLVDL